MRDQHCVYHTMQVPLSSYRNAINRLLELLATPKDYIFSIIFHFVVP